MTPSVNNLCEIIIKMEDLNINPRLNDQISQSFKDDAQPPFTIGKSTIDKLIGYYLSRQFCEELNFLENKGGVNWLAVGLKTSLRDGLTDSESDFIARINAFDSNEPPVEEPISYCSFVWESLQDNIIRILMACALIQTILEVTIGDNPKENWVDGLAIILAVIVVVMVGSINNYIKEKEFRNLKKMMESDKSVILRRQGDETEMPESNILVGDVMKIEEGMTIPADCVLIQGSNVIIDESAMTGEIDGIHKASYEDCQKAKFEFFNEHPHYKDHVPEGAHHKIPSPVVPSGTKVSSGSGYVLILAVGPNSENGKIMATIEANKSDAEGTPLQQKLTAIASFIGKIGIIAAIFTAVAMSIRIGIRFSEVEFQSDDAHYITKIFIISVVVIVVAIPEGLPLAVTISLAFSVKKMLDDKNFVRRMEACETMGGANYICTDKTGTLTKNEMTIVKIHDGVNDINMEDGMMTSPSTVHDYKKFFGSENRYHLLKLCFACNTETSISMDGSSEKATFKTDLTFTKFLRIFDENITELREMYIKDIKGSVPRIGFSSKRKKMSTILTSQEFPEGYRVFTKGASEIVLQSCRYYIDERNLVQELTDHKREELQVKIKSFACEALRTMCAGYKDINYKTAERWNEKIEIGENENKKEVHLIEQDDFILIGIIGIRDILKDGVTSAVINCQKAGITVIMITGDNLDTAVAIAKNANICVEGQIKTGILGETFNEKIGGIVCENCFSSQQYKNIIAENKKVKKKQDHKLILQQINYKCECYRTKDEGIMKIKQKLKDEKLQENPEEMREIYKNKEAKEKFESKLEDEAKEKFSSSGAKIKKDIIANIEKFNKLLLTVRVIARSQPNHKYALVTGLKQTGNVVAVTGDGTNDAPALSKADVGFAMGKMGTDIAKEASDIIIMDDNFASIVGAIKWGRNIYDNIRRFLQFQLSVNIVACSLVFIGVAAGEQSPLSAVQMLWLNMIMDSLGSLALATEKPTDELLKRKPYKRTEFIVNKKMFKHIFGQAMFQLLILLILLFISTSFLYEEEEAMLEFAYGFLKCFPNETSSILFYAPPLENKKINLISGFESSFAAGVNFTNSSFNDTSTLQYCNNTFPYRRNLKDAYKYFLNQQYATTHYTIIFNTFVLMQLFNQVSCRILDDSFNIFARICDNCLFLFIWFLEVICQALIIQFTGPVFKVCSKGLSGPHWGICIGFALLTYVINALIKLVPDNIAKSSFNEELKMSEGKILDMKKNSNIRIKNASLGSKIQKNSQKMMHLYQKSVVISDKSLPNDKIKRSSFNCEIEKGDRSEHNPIIIKMK